jgi:hypothetical protein
VRRRFIRCPEAMEQAHREKAPKQGEEWEAAEDARVAED